MRSNIAFIKGRLAANLAESGTPVTLVWQEWPAGSAVSGVDGSRTGTPTRRTREVRAFVHTVQTGQSQVKQFNEMETGDMILDFEPDVPLDGLDSLRFLVGGQEWSPKQVSDRLARSWDVQAGGVKLFRSVLCRRAT